MGAEASGWGVGMCLEMGTAEPWRWDQEDQQLRHLTGNSSSAQNKQAGVSFLKLKSLQDMVSHPSDLKVPALVSHLGKEKV